MDETRFKEILVEALQHSAEQHQQQTQKLHDRIDSLESILSTLFIRSSGLTKTQLTKMLTNGHATLPTALLSSKSALPKETFDLLYKPVLRHGDWELHKLLSEFLEQNAVPKREQFNMDCARNSILAVANKGPAENLQRAIPFIYSWLRQIGEDFVSYSDEDITESVNFEKMKELTLQAAIPLLDDDVFVTHRKVIMSHLVHESTTQTPPKLSPKRL